MAKKKDVTTSKATQIIDEIVMKVSDYENNMQSMMTRVGEWGDLFQVKPPNRRNPKAFSNPRLTEFFRAVNTLGTMMYRMQTAQDPFFELVPMSLLKYQDQLIRVQATLETQLRESQYKRYLLKADMGMCAFGTQIIEESLATVGVNPLGRRIQLTTFRPRNLLQVAYERGTTDIAEADWISTGDLVSDGNLKTLLDDNMSDDWQKAVLDEAIKDKTTAELNPAILKKLLASQFVGGDGSMKRKELIIYNGRLDTMNDNIEYVCALVNRKYLVKFHGNRNQHGKRDFRIGYWVEDPLCIDPMGLGVGSIAGNLHKSMDANRQRAQDGIAMASYNMWGRLRSAGINDEELKIRPLQIVDMDEVNGLRPLLTDLQGPTAALKLDEILRNEFMAASGATPTLQAQLTDATASEVSLAQNEAVRNISVKAETSAESFIREHIQIMHSNNVQFMDQPITVNQSGFAGKVYPKDLHLDVDCRVKITTDKDYKPQRLQNLKEVLGLLISTKSMHPDMANIKVLPLVKEIVRGLGVNPDEVVPDEGPPDPRMLEMMIAARGGGGLTSQGSPSPEAFAPDQSLGGMGTVQTPVGNVLGSL